MTTFSKSILFHFDFILYISLLRSDQASYSPRFRDKVVKGPGLEKRKWMESVDRYNSSIDTKYRSHTTVSDTHKH